LVGQVSEQAVDPLDCALRGPGTVKQITGNNQQLRPVVTTADQTPLKGLQQPLAMFGGSGSESLAGAAQVNVSSI